MDKHWKHPQIHEPWEKQWCQDFSVEEREMFQLLIKAEMFRLKSLKAIFRLKELCPVLKSQHGFTACLLGSKLFLLYASVFTYRFRDRKWQIKVMRYVSTKCLLSLLYVYFHHFYIKYPFSILLIFPLFLES